MRWIQRAVFALLLMLCTGGPGALAQAVAPESGFAGLLVQSAEGDQRAAVGAASMRGGLLVRDMFAGGAAARAGLRRGDLIVAYEGAPITSLHQLVGFMQGNRPGQTVTFETIRFGERRSVPVMLDPWPQGWLPNPALAVLPALGLTVEALSTDVRNTHSVPWGTLGVRVRALKPDGAAAVAGLQVGDILRAIDRTPVFDPAALHDLVRANPDRWMMLAERERHRFLVGPGAPATPPVAGSDMLVAALSDGAYVMDVGEGASPMALGGSIPAMPLAQPDPAAAEVDVPDAGLGLATVSPEIRAIFKPRWNARGLMVARVAPASRAARAGVRAGMVLREINQQPVSDLRQTADLLTAALTAPQPVLLLAEDKDGFFLAAFGGP